MTQIRVPETTKKVRPVTSTDIPGKITELIGSGKHAQAAIVWQTIKWSFFLGGLFSLIFVIQSIYLNDKASTMDEIKSVWAIFIPVITLAMGYAFGKGKD